MLARRLRRLGDRILRLALGANEQDLAAAGGGLLDEIERALEQAHGLIEVDDVDAVARAVDERRHLRVPAMLLVAEMNARFEKLTHGEIRQCHDYRVSFTGYASAGL